MPADEPMSRAVPLLKSWVRTANGTVEGYCYGKEGFKDSTLLETSKVLHITDGWCATENGRCYRLGEPREESSGELPPDVVAAPVLEQWEWCDLCNGVSGLVYGKPGFSDGEWIRTSEIPAHQRFEAYVVTKSGSKYRLGAPKVAMNAAQAQAEELLMM